MMVWMWYDCMIVVWWFGSCVCECCECIQIEEIAKNCKTINRLKEPQKISLTFKFFRNISPNTATRDSLKISEDSRKTSSVVILFAFVYPCVSPEDPEEQKCYFLYYYIKKYTILKSLQGLQEHQGHTHTQTKTRLKTSLRRSPDFTIQSSGSSGTQAANRAHLDSTKFLFSSKYFSQAKVPEKYGSQEIQS